MKPVTLAEAGRVLDAMERCPDHPGWIVLPLFGKRACCLIEALERIRAGEEKPQEIAAAALKSPPGVIIPRMRLRRSVRGNVHVPAGSANATAEPKDPPEDDQPAEPEDDTHEPFVDDEFAKGYPLPSRPLDTDE